jgi:hypothetical protein
MTTKPWSELFDRINLSDTDNAQVMVLDTTVSPSSDENQRTPVTEILRSGKNLIDLKDLVSARKNITNLLSQNVIYVSDSGSDTNGNGSNISAFQSISHSISYAKSNGISSTNPFTCIILGGKTDDSAGQIIVPPYFNIKGETQGTIISNSSDIIIDSSAWSSVSNALSYFQDIKISGNLTLDYSSISNPSIFQIQNNNVYVGGTFVMRGNSVISPILNNYNCFFHDCNFDYVNINSFSNNYSTILRCSIIVPNSSCSLNSSSDNISNFSGSGPSSGSVVSSYKIHNAAISTSFNYTGQNTTVYIDSASLGLNPFITTDGNAKIIYLDNPLYFQNIPPVTITGSSVTLNFSTDFFILNNISNGIYTLPFASGNAGRKTTIKKISGSAITAILQTQSGDNFFDTSLTNSISLNVGSSVTLESDGNSTWHVI